MKQTAGRIVRATADVLIWITVVTALFMLMGSVFKNEKQLSPWGTGAFTVQTGSMSPALKPGTMIFVQKVPLDTLKPGDIVTMMDPADQTAVTHRIVEISMEDNLITTKGDANNRADRPVPLENVVGRVVFFLPGLGQAPGLLRNSAMYGWLFTGFGIMALSVGIAGVVKAGRRPLGRVEPAAESQ